MEMTELDKNGKEYRRDGTADERKLMNKPESGQRREAKMELTLKNEFRNYFRHSSMHGLRYLVEPSMFNMRRILWLIAILVVVTLYFYSVIGAIMYYLSYPTSMIYTLQQNMVLAFPTITICNLNQCRLSTAQKLPYHEDRFMPTDSESNLTTYYEDCAHNKYDMITSCEWNDLRCEPSDFDSVVIDSRICYVFAPKSKGVNVPLTVDKAGTKFGLKLTVNTEQYKYTGYSPEAGLKIYVHDASSLPDPGEAMMVGAGTNNLIAVQSAETRALPVPYGVCVSSKELEYFQVYNEVNCRVECRAKYLLQKCGCIDEPLLPVNILKTGVNDSVTICTVGKYYDCVLGAVAEFKTESINLCNCTPNCLTRKYKTATSQATMAKAYLASMDDSSSAIQINRAIQGYSDSRLKRYASSTLTTDHEEALFRHFLDGVSDLASWGWAAIRTSVQSIIERMQTLSEARNGWGMYRQAAVEAINQYNRTFRYQLTEVFEGARLTLTSYLDVLSSYAYVHGRTRASNKQLDPTERSLLKYKRDNFRMQYDHTMAALEFVESLFIRGRLKDLNSEQRRLREEFRFGLESLKRNESAVAALKTSEFFRFYAVAEDFRERILPRGEAAYKQFGTRLSESVINMRNLENSLNLHLRILANEFSFCNDCDTNLLDITSQWNRLYAKYFTNQNSVNVDVRKEVYNKTLENLKYLTKLMDNLSRHLKTTENSTYIVLNTLEQMYTVCIDSVLIKDINLGKFAIWNETSSIVEMPTKWGNFAHSRQLFKSVFQDIMGRLKSKYISGIPKHPASDKKPEFQSLTENLANRRRLVLEPLKTFSSYMESFLDSINKTNINSGMFYFDNFLTLNVYLKDLTTETYTMVAMSSPQSLLIAIGSFGAIFIGASLVTLLEIVDVVLHHAAKRFCRPPNSKDIHTTSTTAV
ncbi:uncharacterized protein LOC141905447 [Tubulanus polymorphus]|uniref:uncharacterized protein LOC141905447 n=1 Tax=Tubulanus polymorphus TaxID=672921 RepID=UPI003DA4748D